MTESLSILVFGAGAIGTYIGGSLALTGHRLTFIEQPAAAEELRLKGLRLDLVNNKKERFKKTVPSVNCVTSIEEALNFSPYDFSIFALKSYDTAEALRKIAPFAGKMPPVLCLQNGVENEKELAAVLGVERVIPGTVTSSVGRRGVGEIVLERLRGVGLADGHPLSLFIWQALQAAELNPRLFQKAADMKWSKMLTNLSANATAAILEMSPSEIFSNPLLFHLEIRMLRETLAVMRAMGIHVVDLPGTPTRLLAMGTNLPAMVSRPLMRKAVGGGRGGKMPSFYIDLHSGRGKSEVDWLNGAVVRYGASHHVPTPINRILTGTLLSLTRGEIPLSEFSQQPDRLLSMIQIR